MANTDPDPAAVRAACERLRRIEKGEEVSAVYTDGRHFQFDTALVARAYLAATPAPASPLLRPLTQEEAERAYDEAPEIPLSKERIDEIVEYATSGGKAPASPAAQVDVLDEESAAEVRGILAGEVETGRPAAPPREIPNAPASPAAGEREVRRSKDDGTYSVWAYQKLGGLGGRWPRLIAEGLSKPDADLLATGYARIARLRELLQEYGRHSEGCSAAHGDQYRCRCGWREESAALAAGGKK